MGYSGFLVNLKDNSVLLSFGSGCKQLRFYIRKQRSRSIMLIIVAQTDRFILKHKRYEREAGCSSWEPLGILQRHRTVRVRKEQLQKLPPLCAWPLFCKWTCRDRRWFPSQTKPFPSAHTRTGSGCTHREVCKWLETLLSFRLHSDLLTSYNNNSLWSLLTTRVLKL